MHWPAGSLPGLVWLAALGRAGHSTIVQVRGAVLVANQAKGQGCRACARRPPRRHAGSGRGRTHRRHERRWSRRHVRPEGDLHRRERWREGVVLLHVFVSPAHLSVSSSVAPGRTRELAVAAGACAHGRGALWPLACRTHAHTHTCTHAHIHCGGTRLSPPDIQPLLPPWDLSRHFLSLPPNSRAHICTYTNGGAERPDPRRACTVAAAACAS